MKKGSVYSVSALVIVLLISCVFLLGLVRGPSPSDLILLRAGTIDTALEPPDVPRGLKLMELSLEDKAYYIVQFRGPIKEQWKAKMKDVGGAFFDYLPNNAFIVKMDGDILDTVKGFPEIKWIGLYQPDYKVDPQLTAKAQGMGEAVTVTVQTFEAQEIAEVRNTLQGLGAEILASSSNKWGGTIRVRIAPCLIPQIINLPWIKWVEEYIPFKLFSDRAVTPGEMNVINVWTQGLTGTGQIVAVADTGLDIGVDDATLHLDFQGAVLATYGLGVGRGGDWSDQHGHGTHVSGSVLGRGTVSGGTYRGVAYDAQLVFQSILDANGGLLGGVGSLGDLFLPPYNDGARIHSNSWGAYASGAYTANSQAVDQFMWDHKDMLVVFAAGNEGIDMDSDGVIDLDSMASPATAKNVLTVGANENDRNVAPFTWYYWDGWGYTSPPFNTDPITDNPSGMAAFSSRGPCDDGRMKPDVVAPGTFVASARTHKHAFNDMMATNDTSQWTWDAPWNYGWDALISGYKWSTGGADPVDEKSLVMANPVDLRMGGDTLFFGTTYSLGDDEAYIDISDDGFSSLASAGPFTGSSGGWTNMQLYFGDLIMFGMLNPQTIQFRFRLVSGGANHGSGWEINRVRVYSTGWARMPEMGIGASWDTTDENYYFMGGTSMATPLTAGAAALVRQHYVDNEGISPSAALIKATLISGATDMPGQYGSYEIVDEPRPNMAEGWGRVNLQNAIFPTGRVLEYLDETSGLSIGESRTVIFQNNSAADLTVTLVWTDYPSTPAAGVNLVNDLDLTLTDPSSTIHYPNGLSTYDRRNNVEVVDLSSPSVGEYTITISGYNIPQGLQSFALVAGGDIDSWTVFYPPNAPANLIATGISNNRVDLSWTDNSADEDGFTIERKRGASGTYSEIAGVGQDVTMYSDILSEHGTYYYRVRAYNGVGNSSYSNEAHETLEDIDGDSLPDDWEITYFGDLSQGPNDDFDADGLTNLGEYLRGTDPTVVNNVVLVLTPPDPITIPRGGDLVVQVTIINNTDNAGTVHFATNVTLPNGNTYPTSGYLFGPKEIALNPHQSKSGQISQTIPAGAPLGTYTYHGYIGRPGVGIMDRDQFDFEVVTAPALPGAKGWETMVDRDFTE